MKKFTLSLGYISVIMVFVAAIFKTEHWPGSGVMIVFGSIIFALVYSPLLFFQRNKFNVTKYHKFLNFWVLFLMIIIPTGFVFKIMHWPGGGIGIMISHIALISLIPLMIIHAVKEKDESKKFNLHNDSIVLIFITAFSVFLWFGGISKYIYNQFIPIDRNIQKEIKIYSNKTNELYSIFESSVKANPTGKKYFDIATELNAKSDSLVNYIIGIENELIALSEQEKFPLDSLGKLIKKESYDIPTRLLVGTEQDGKNGKGTEYKNMLISYYKFAEKNTNNRGRYILESFFNTNDPVGQIDRPEEKYWVTIRFYNTPLISVLVAFNMDILHIRMLESETMEYLQFMGSKEMPVVKNELRK
jgi:hypothetical protein